MNSVRREFLRAMVLAFGCSPVGSLFAQANATTTGNFAYVYGNAALREEFKKFLVNVFHLYPEDDLHALIAQALQQGLSDQEVYRQVQAQLGGIKPLLGDVTYSLPTLAKQKRVLAHQTALLLGERRRYEGYLEIGSNGRFLDSLEERLDIVGDSFTMSDRAPTNSAIDIVDRGQLRRAGPFIALNDYRPKLGQHVPAGSVDLVTVYIGFHHCPLELRPEFMGEIRQVLRPGGALIVRDHNVHNEKMWRMVALAHDVFNMGTKETWQYNEDERRAFYSLATLDRTLASAGFKAHARRLLQQGDPTLNTLMLYTRV